MFSESNTQANIGERLGLYVMQVASMLTGLHPQTLRKYERAGLLTPSRSNMLRMYSDEDIARLKMIRQLVNDIGLNLAGVEMVLKIRSKLLSLKEELKASAIGTKKEERLEQLVDELLELFGAI